MAKADSNSGGGVPLLDGSVTMKVSKDKLEVLIIPKEGFQLGVENLEAIKKELAQQGICHGILEKPILGKDGSFCVAKGEAPQPGKDGVLRPHVRPVMARTPKAVGGKGVMDHRELQSISNVSKDQLLLEKILPAAGTPGKDVEGKELPAKGGRDIKIKNGQGTYLSEDGLNVFSACNGKFVMADGKPSVFDEHVVRGDVDMSVGNIAFGGRSLMVDGAVLPGFQLKCRGDISVAKGVHSSRIMAGGKLDVRGGIVGEESKVMAKGDVSVDFVENIDSLESGGQLIISDFIVQGRHLQVSQGIFAVQGKGLIVGGDCLVGKSVHVKELGTDAGVETRFTLGMDKAFMQHKEQTEKDFALWSERFNETLKNVNSLEHMKSESGGKMEEDKKRLLIKMKEAMPRIMEKVNLLQEAQEKIEEELERRVNECIYVYERVFPGVSVKIGPAIRVLNEEEERVVIYFDKPTRQIKLRKLTPEEQSAMEGLIPKE